MLKKTFLICFFQLLLFEVNAQDKKPLPLSAIDGFNNFQHAIGKKSSSDSAVYFLNVIIADKRFPNMLADLVHNAFFQTFLRPESNDSADIKSRVFATKVLSIAMSDTSKVLRHILHPVDMVVKIQDARGNSAKMLSLTNNFMNSDLQAKDAYAIRSLRYGLMIHQIISKQAGLKNVSDKLFAQLFDKLKNNQVPFKDNLSNSVLEQRAWFRYLFAYANYVKANRTTNLNEKGLLLKTGFDFSPDLTDKSHKSGYYYDRFFLMGENGNFQDEYLDFLAKTNKDPQKLVSVLLKMSLVEPEYKDKLKVAYNTANTSGPGFEDFWKETVYETGKPAPAILLNLLDAKAFSSKAEKDKWILVDFWGTWCGPCRQEHPDLEKFYESDVLSKSDKISLLTIACSDTEKKVVEYMAEKHFSFPVAMSDNLVENLYVVSGYPTKVLISPKGKYIKIPFGVDWADFVNKYCSL